jgi:hypothetical protein
MQLRPVKTINFMSHLARGDGMNTGKESMLDNMIVTDKAKDHSQSNQSTLQWLLSRRDVAKRRD